MSESMGIVEAPLLGVKLLQLVLWWVHAHAGAVHPTPPQPNVVNPTPPIEILETIS